MDLLIGSHNRGKIHEFRLLLADAPVRLLSLDDIGLHELEVDETGVTFEDNAAKKALAYAQAGGMFAIADDSGLVVDALDGRPGLYSARYGEQDLDERGRRLRLLQEMGSIPDDRRTARFTCVVAVANPNTMTTYTVMGMCEGRIARYEDTVGQGGFGYDPVFIPDGYDVSFASLPSEVKNRLSHRGRAVQQIIPILARLSAEMK